MKFFYKKFLNLNFLRINFWYLFFFLFLWNDLSTVYIVILLQTIWVPYSFVEVWGCCLRYCKLEKKSIFSKVFKLSANEQGCFGTGLGMFLRLYDRLYVSCGLTEKTAKNISKNGFLGGKSFLPLWTKKAIFWGIFRDLWMFCFSALCM